MDFENMKNMIILRDIQSNVIEEAYIVLKSNVKLHKVKMENMNKNAKYDKSKEKECIVKEAEMIINEYAKKIEDKENELGGGNKKIKEKYKKLKALTIFLAIFSALSVLSILLR